MTTLSIRLPDKLLRELDHGARLHHLPRSEYIRKAIEFMNQETQKQARKQRMAKASLRVREESMKINEEFSRIEHDPEED